MDECNEKIRHILQFLFDNGRDAAHARKEICEVYGQGALSKATANKYFARFRAGNFDISNAPSTDTVQPIVENVEDSDQPIDEILEKI